MPKAPKPRTLYRVKGRWPFPTDMLRYDNSEPTSETMAALVEKLSDQNCPDDICLRQVYEIELHLKFPVRGGLPYGGGRRWESFMWRVSEMPYRENSDTHAYYEQKQWVAEHGGDLAGYIARYGEERGPAIYEADTAALKKLEGSR